MQCGLLPLTVVFIGVFRAHCIAPLAGGRGPRAGKISSDTSEAQLTTVLIVEVDDLMKLAIRLYI